MKLGLLPFVGAQQAVMCQALTPRDRSVACQYQIANPCCQTTRRAELNGVRAVDSTEWARKAGCPIMSLERCAGLRL
jgi:hypothetical protein